MEGLCGQSEELVRVKEEPEAEAEPLPPPAAISQESVYGDFSYLQAYLGDHTYARREFPQTDGNLKKAVVQYLDCLKAKHVKQEAEYVNVVNSTSDSRECGVSKESMLTGLGTNCMYKDLMGLEHLKNEPLDCDLGMSETPTQTGICNDRLNDVLMLGPEIGKDEPCIDSGLSEAATQAGLYNEHAVKDELVLGPEHPHRPDVTLAVRSWTLADAGGWSAMPVQVRARALKRLKDCSVKLERLHHHEAIAANRCPPHENTTSNKINARVDSKKWICDLCGERFARKSCLIQHAISHIHIPSIEQNDKHATDEKSSFLIRDCFVRLERLPGDPKTKSVLSSQQYGPQQKNTNTYVCDTCDQTFLHKHSLVRHFKVHLQEKSHILQNNSKVAVDIRPHTRKKPYTCIFCKKVFKLERDLIRHEVKHTGQKSYFCEICKKAFARADYVKLHKKLVHCNGNGKFTCEICQKDFKLLQYLLKHKIIHTARKTYSCVICNKRFKEFQSLRIHRRIHTGERKYQCEICNMKFTTSGTLNVHKRIHTGERPYSCTICTRQFTHLQSLNAHTKLHTGEKSYECESCKRRFTQLASLNSHRRLHKGVKRYICGFCQKAFMHLSTLNKHKLTHIGVKQHACEICEKRFLLVDQLKAHLKTHMRVKR